MLIRPRVGLMTRGQQHSVDGHHQAMVTVTLGRLEHEPPVAEGGDARSRLVAKRKGKGGRLVGPIASGDGVGELVGVGQAGVVGDVMHRPAQQRSGA